MAPKSQVKRRPVVESSSDDEDDAQQRKSDDGSDGEEEEEEDKPQKSKPAARPASKTSDASSSSTQHSTTVTSATHNQRLDSLSIGGVTRSALQRLIKQKQGQSPPSSSHHFPPSLMTPFVVRVNGRVMEKAGYKVKTGDSIV
jgi:hypothetical protein